MYRKACSFFGEWEIKDKAEVLKLVEKEIEKLIKQGYQVFYFGGVGMFDKLCYQATLKLKAKYKKIDIIYVYFNEAYMEATPLRLFFSPYEWCDDYVYFPMQNHREYNEIYYRNIEMINRSDFVIMYQNPNKAGDETKTLQYIKKAKPNSYVNLFN